MKSQTSVAAAEAVDDIGPPTYAEYRDLPLAQLRLSPLNPRKYFDPERLAELAASMGGGVGIIEPLVVRPHHGQALPTTDATTFEIVAGARRYKAAHLAGLATVPVSIRVLTDAQVLELMVIENDQRQDITPLEEADGFKRLISKFGVDIDRLAARIGRSRKYIYDRVKLLELIAPAQRLLEAQRITAGHAILLARLTKDQQARAITPPGKHDWRGDRAPLFVHDASLLNDADAAAEEQDAKKDPYVGLKAKSVRDLEAWIADHCRFDPALDVQRELYPMTVARVEDAKKVVHIHRGHFAQPDAREDDPQRIFGSQSWRRADGLDKSKVCTKSALGVVVVGEGRGEAFEVCVNRDCPVHFKKEKAAKARKAAAGPDKWAQQQAARREREARGERARDAKLAAVKHARPQLLAAAVAAVQKASLGVLVAEVGRQFTTAHVTASTKQLGAPKTADAALRVFVLSEILDAASGNWAYELLENLPKLLKGVGVDQAAIVKAASAAVHSSAKAKAAAKPGTCRFCGCTEDVACEGGCGWVDQDETVCSTPACVAAWKREDKATRRAAKKAKAAKKP